MKKFIANFFFIVLSFLAGKAAGQERTYTTPTGMQFILVQPGNMTVGKYDPPYPVPADTVTGAQRPVTMWMGEGRSYNSAEFRLARELALRDASPGFQVNIANPFYIGKFEVSQAEWRKVMGRNPSVFQGSNVPDSDRHPVENVTWEDVQVFLGKLNEMDTTHHYRLPTEFEWEYAARAGASGDIAWSETQLVAQLGGSMTQPVGQKKPNGWGLYDMLGNVWEWVDDYYNEKLFADPTPPLRGRVHVLKGASFAGDVKNATWLTHAAGPGNGWDVGFRLVMEVSKN